MQVKKPKNRLFLWIMPLGLVIVILLLSTKSNSKDVEMVVPTVSQETDLNSFQLILKEKNFRKIKSKRNEALSIGVLQTEDTDFVPASIRYQNDSYDAKVRLKGDWTDHLIDDKWSFRIKLDDDRTIKGMRKFSIHHPGTRGYLNEWLYHKAIKDNGIMGLRYGFLEGFLHVKLKNIDTLLTNNVGIYAIEETFDKRLIESNGRKVGVILKLTEEDMWKESAKIHALGKATGTSTIGKFNPKYGSDKQMTITAYSLGKVFEDKSLQKQFKLAKNLLNNYKSGNLRISQIFDIPITAKFTVLANLFGGIHGLTSHNLRFFYNPITSMIEPIAFDNNSGVPLKEFRHYWKSANDAAYTEALVAALEEISTPEYLENLVNTYRHELDSLSIDLKKEFKNQSILSLETLRQNQVVLRQKLKELKSEN